MVLENIIKKGRETNQQTLVNIPVVVEAKTIEKIKIVVKRIPSRWFVYLMIGPIILLLIFLIIRTVSETPDLEISAPIGGIRTVTTTPTPFELQSVQSGGLSDLLYRDEKEGFVIRPPEGWQIDQSGKTGAVVVFLNPVTKSIGNVSYATLISVEKQKLEEASLVDQVKMSKENISKQFPSIIFEKDSLFYLNGQPYYLIGGQYTVNGVDMRRRSLVTLYKGYGYAVSASGPLVTWGDNETNVSDSQFSFRLL